MNYSDLTGSQWLSKEELEALLVENINDIDYQNFIAALERLLSLPYSYKVKDFIMKYRQELLVQKNKYVVAKPETDANGTQYVTTYGKSLNENKIPTTLLF